VLYLVREEVCFRFFFLHVSAALPVFVASEMGATMAKIHRAPVQQCTNI